MKTQLHLSKKLENLTPYVTPVKNNEHMVFTKKPMYQTGFWTSSWDESMQTSEWVEWCRNENFGDPYKLQWYLLDPEPEAKIYTINTALDLSILIERYLYLPYQFKTAFSGLSEEMVLNFRGIDFEKMAEEYDGLHLTEEGNARLHLSMPFDMNAWDAESTLWFHWCFRRAIMIQTPEGPFGEDEDQAS